MAGLNGSQNIFELSVGAQDNLSFGFAAGCEAVATPRHRCAIHVLGYALGAASGPIKIRAKP